MEKEFCQLLTFDCSWFACKIDDSSCFADAKSDAWAATSDEWKERKEGTQSVERARRRVGIRRFDGVPETADRFHGVADGGENGLKLGLAVVLAEEGEFGVALHDLIEDKRGIGFQFDVE